MPHGPGRGTLIGRDDDVAAIGSLLADARLVVLTGPGGIGKSSIAAAVLAGASPAERWFVDASPSDDAEALALAVAADIGLVVDQAGGARDAVERFLASRTAVVVLDGAERVRGAGALVDRWIAALPRLHLLVTSRAPLRGRSGVEVPVKGLAVPDGATPSAVVASPAGALFLRRARQVGVEVELDAAAARALQAVLRRLDGIPLAIELAAGRSRILTPAALLRRLDQPDVLAAPASDAVDGPPDRHASLASVLALTIDLLSPGERRILACLTVFPGLFDLDLAETVAAGEGSVVAAMDAFVGLGLVRREDDLDGEPRFRMLETIRVQARDQLSAADRDDALRALAHAVAARTAAAASGPKVAEAAMMRALSADDDNVATAIEWCIDNDPSLGLVILDSIDRYLVSGVRLDRSVRWLRLLLDRAPADAPARARCLGTLFRLLVRSAPREAMLLAPEIEAAAMAADGRERRTAYLRLAFAHHAIGDPVTAARYDTLAAEASEDPDDAGAIALDSEATLAWATAGDFARAGDLLRRSAQAHERAGATLNAGIGWFKCALVELRDGRAGAAEEAARIAVTLCAAGNIRAFALDVLAMALADRGATMEARAVLVESWAIVEKESLVDRLEAVESAVALLAAEGRSAEALATLAAADRERPTSGWVRDPHVTVVLERWRTGATRTLTGVPALLAVEEGRGVPLEVAMAGALAAPPSRGATDRGTRARDGLTAREVEVLALVGDGRSDTEISEALYISPKTASVHVANIKGKLGVASRVDVALHARELGLRPVPRDAPGR